LSKSEFCLDFSAPKRRHDDARKYIIYVLWLIGYSERSIAITLEMRVKQVAGIVGRSDYKGRSSMTDQERRMLLNELRQIRYEDGVPLDGGKLDKISWDLRPLGESQLRGPLRRKMR
jgi:hypothetical protein